MMKLLFTLLFIVVTAISSAQKRNIYFLKNDGRQVSLKDSADYIRVVSEPDPGSVLYNVAEFYPNEKKMSLGKSSAIDPIKLEGQCIEFFNSGARKSITEYKGGYPINEQYLFYPNGKTYQIRSYIPTPAINTINHFDIFYKVKACYDSSGIALVNDGNGYYKGYDKDFKNVNEEGNILNGQRSGVWKGYEAGNSYTENYLNGQLQSGTAIRKDGSTYHYEQHRGTPPQYKGGMQAFYEYVGYHVHYPEIARRNNTEGTVIISFVVEKDGKLSDLKLLRAVSPEIDEEAVRVVSESRKWIPGTMYGQPARIQYSLPLKFALK